MLQNTIQSCGASTNVAYDCMLPANSKFSLSIYAVPPALTCSLDSSIIAEHPGSYDTDPQSTFLLWKLVSSMSDNRPASIQSRSISSKINQRELACIPGCLDFPRKVLQPRGIIISRSHYPPMSAFDFFGTTPPAPEVPPTQHYTALPKLHNTTIWLDTNITATAEAAETYLQLHCEAPPLAQWTLAALTAIFKAETCSRLRTIEDHPLEDAADNDGNSSTDRSRCWLPMQLAGESFACPTQAERSGRSTRWAPPPAVSAALDEASATSSLPLPAVAPTCSYWLWTGGFRPTTPSTLGDLTSLRYGRAACPYLSVQVEGTADEASRARGLDVLAVAGATALYNAWRLFKKLQQGPTDVDEERNDDAREAWKSLKHFGVLLAGASWEFWVLEPSLDGVRWAGCQMNKVAGGASDRKGELGALFEWVNEIQRWGNTKFAQACVAVITDIVERRRKDCGIR